MNKYELINNIEQIAPLDSAEVWDCVGFMVETAKKDVSKVMLCLTVTESVIKQAHEQKCDMIISHHPMFTINCNSGLVSESYVPLIDIYSAHTNLDKAKCGTTDTLITNLGLSKNNIEHEFLRFVDFKDGIEVTDFVDMLRKISPNLRYVNNYGKKSIICAAFCAGSGADFIDEAQKLGADCLVTGDLKFHTALDSNIVVVDVGHFESEILMIPVLKEFIGTGVEVVFAKEQSPFKFLE